jgi:membrane protein DedA with SNARE-associated domain
MIQEMILLFAKDHGILVSFLGGFITGETIIIPIAFLSANGFIPLWQVLIFCTLGMYLSDFIPFTIGRFKFLRNLFKGKSLEHAKRLENRFLKLTKSNIFLTLLYTKFIYGLSIPALIYLGHKETSYSRFALYNLLVEIIFVPIVILIGWTGGKGFTIVQTIFKDVRIAILLLILFIITVFFIRKWVNKELTKRQIRLK